MGFIQNEYGEKEKVDQFIIRHTRLVPRDVINICNELAKLHLEVTSYPEVNVENRIREIVLSNSRTIGEELITICAKNITANTLPLRAGNHAYSEGFTANQYYHESTYSKVLSILSDINIKELSYVAIKSLDTQADKIFGSQTYFSDILWQNGVFGFKDNNKRFFYAQRFKGDHLLPKDKKEYIIRSCVEQKLSIMK